MKLCIVQCNEILVFQVLYVTFRLVVGLALTDGCLQLLGKPLNKGERMSNWDQRPLTLSQCIYASLDAHSLLGMLDRILSYIGAPERSGAGDMYIDDEINQLLAPLTSSNTTTTTSTTIVSASDEAAATSESAVSVAAAVHPWALSWRNRFVKT